MDKSNKNGMDGVKRYEIIGKDDPDRQAKLKAQREEFERDAQSGKVLCLSDLMCSHGM